MSGQAALPAHARAQEILGHDFAKPDLLREALTHRSAVAGRLLARGRTARSNGAGSNERLEFIGDRVLGLLIAEWLAERFPQEQEGQLGPRLAHLVSQPVLAGIAERLGLPAVLQVAPGESRAGVRRLATVLADAMEALIGALYLDGGLETARRFVRHAWDDPMNSLAEPPKDPKTALQEWLLARGMQLPNYTMVSREGPPHDPVFVIAVAAAGQEGTGTAGSKRIAERLAAEDLLRKLRG
ncbi:ribonuclease III [Rhodovastum atsumiense]|uniref:Ribonuclease 3 n=1 Tax=Rhodovastum atsumiense TaxID=504468 RepID=A0A5M6IQK8_9PROT|nr:ribonuclease III [Rhodovastum atsumiense]